jgi:AcrR family transcriptional regulator
MFNILNMGSTRPDDPPAADLTAQARIRNAAVAHVAREGFRKANLRAIAATAGVSAGLVIHYFGSKDALRAACDAHVLRVLTQRARDDARPAGMQDVLRDYMADPEEYRLQVLYMARVIEEDSPAAATFVNTMVEESEAIHRAGVADGTMHPSSDPRALAVLNVLTSLALLTMAPPLARALGHEAFGPEVLRRMALPTLELYTRGLYTDDVPLTTARDALAGDLQGQAPRQEGAPRHETAPRHEKE